MTFRIVEYHLNSMIVVAHSIPTIEEAEARQAEFYAAREADNDADYLIEGEDA